MAKTVKVRLITPTKLEVEGDYAMLVVPGVMGSFAVLPRRAPIISHIDYGMLLLCENRDNPPTKANADKRFFIGAGTALAKDDVCTILTEEAIRSDKVDRTVIAGRISESLQWLKDPDIPEKIKERTQISIRFLDMVLDTLERENPRPVIKGR